MVSATLLARRVFTASKGESLIPREISCPMRLIEGVAMIENFLHKDVEFCELILPGEIFGEEVLFAGQPSKHVVALSPCKYDYIEPTAKDIAESLFKRKQRLEALLEGIANRNVYKRINELFRWLKDVEPICSFNGREFEYKLTHVNIAMLTGISRSTVTKTLKKLRYIIKKPKAYRRIFVNPQWFEGM